MLRLDDIKRQIGARVLFENLSWVIPGGARLGLVGPNGAGKTTTLRCASGIIPPSSGSVRISGFDLVKDSVEAKRRLAFVPDEPRLFDYLTARDHLRITARLYGVADGAARAETLLEELELGDRKDAYPAELSRGMKQKLMVAMALLHRPEALLLDEPLTGLDPAAMRRMKDRIRETARSGVAVILSSHMLHLVEELCRRVAIVVAGKMAHEGTLDEIRGALPEGGRGDLESIFLRAVGEGGTD